MAEPNDETDSRYDSGQWPGGPWAAAGVDDPSIHIRSPSTWHRRLAGTVEMTDFLGYQLPTPAQIGEAQSSADEVLAVIEGLKPRPCPHPLIRVGGSRDGAYLLPDDLAGVRACFSPGVGNRKDFEDELAREYDIPSHMCDRDADTASLRTPLIEGLQTIDQQWLDIDGSADSTTLTEWLAARHPDGEDDLLLQMDIEGAEYRNLLATPRETLARFRIVILELHRLQALRDAAVLHGVFEPLLERLADFTPVHAHPNNCCGDWTVTQTGIRCPRVLELTFLRNDRMATPAAQELPPVHAPHALDIVNSPRKAPLFLDASWLPNPRTVESQRIIDASASASPADPDASSEAPASLAREPRTQAISPAEVILQVSRRRLAEDLRRSPVEARRSPLADVLDTDVTLKSLLGDLDTQLIFAFMPLPGNATGTRPEDHMKDVDTEMLERLRDGRAYLVVDHSGEGPGHNPEFSELLHGWCRHQSVPASALVYVSANEGYAAQYADWCDEQRITDRYQHLLFNIYLEEVVRDSLALHEQEVHEVAARRGPRPFRFLCFNFAPRPERIVVAAHLLSVEPPDALVSLGPLKNKVTPEGSLAQVRRRYSAGRFHEQHAQLLDQLDFESIRSRTTLEPPDPADDVPLYKKFDLPLYGRSYISIVNETEMSNGRVRRITEKAIKPFLFGHAAIVAGNPGALGMLRSMGFATFDPLIDESYDEIANPNERLCAVLCEVDRLRALSDTQLQGLFDDLREIRLANVHYGRTALRHRLRNDAVAQMTSIVLDGMRVDR